MYGLSTEGEEIGEVTEILQTGANDVWTVKPEKEKHIIFLILKM